MAPMEPDGPSGAPKPPRSWRPWNLLVPAELQNRPSTQSSEQLFQVLLPLKAARAQSRCQGRWMACHPPLRSVRRVVPANPAPQVCGPRGCACVT